VGVNDSPELSYAPWSEDQVRNLEEWQATPWVHPYTCADCRDADPDVEEEHLLVPTVDGWTCPSCPRRQGWCLALMLDGPWPDPLSVALRSFSPLVRQAFEAQVDALAELEGRGPSQTTDSGSS
jgi:hypothetical protein